MNRSIEHTPIPVSVDRPEAQGTTRRQFIQSTAFVGGCAALANLSGCAGRGAPEKLTEVGHYPLADPEKVIYSTCLQCHVDCQIKGKILDGTLAKLTGNPYSPQNYLPHLPYNTDLKRAARADGKLCPKGQSGIQTYYDPYRIRKVLKRAGKRGENKWQTIEFGQFIDEVAKGGQLFKSIGDDRYYPGFDEVCALRDRDLAKLLKEDAAKFAKGDMTLDQFKSKHADHLDKLIDPDHPDLGPKNNGFVFCAGRIEHGRKELMKWFTHNGFGSSNAYDHTTICEQSHHIAYDEMTGGATHHMKPDLHNAEFVIFWGTGAFTANFGLTPMAEKVTTGKVSGRLKTAVVDPRLSNDAAKADWWLPVKPGADGALAYWMIRWILDNKRYDARYLSNANKAAAVADGEPTWTNATHLVKIVDGVATELLTAEEAGIGSADQVVVSRNGKFVALNPDDATNPIEGDLLVSAEINGIKVKSAFQLIYDEAFSRTPEQYAELTGIEHDTVAQVARELTSHGKRAAVEMYRGPVQHTDGFYAGCAVITLNLLIGNPDWKGGLSKGGSHWHEDGSKLGGPYPFKTMHPSSFPTFGPPITREKTRYEDSSLFRKNGYPAKRPWYPLSSNVYQEIIPSFAAGYPYKGQILFLHKGTPAFATPAGDKTIQMLMDPDRIPLFIACDVVIGETSMYADYIIPDLTYLERWGTPHVTPDIPTTTSKVRQPIGVPLTEEVSVDGEVMPISLEAFLIALAKKLNLPGFGKNGFGEMGDFNRPEDWYLKLIANMAAGDKPDDNVPDASDEELTIFRKARRHLPPSVFNEEKWKAAVKPELWKKVVYVLNRGGRFAPFSKAYDGDYMNKKLGKMFYMFMPKVASHNNSLTGKPFVGYPVYAGQFDASGKPLDRNGQYPLALITYKEPFGGQSRTPGNYWSNISLQPANKVLINQRTAEELGIRPGQHVRVSSASNPKGTWELGHGLHKEIFGQVHICQGIRPGVVAVSWHYGHWAYGARDIRVDGQHIAGDPRRGKGLCPNAVMTTDPVLKDVCLTDPVGASASFYDTHVNLVPA